MRNLPGHVGDLGCPPERLGPQPEPRRLVDTRCDADGRVGTFAVDRPAECRPEVCDLVVHEPVDDGFAGAAEQFKCSLGLIGEKHRMPFARRLAFSALR